MKIKTSDLIRPALNWAVSEALGLDWWQPEYGESQADYSGNWSQGGPIIEQNDISFRKYHNPKSEAHGTYYARVCQDSGTLIGWHKTTGFQQTGPTPLVAAMRCFVASRLGDEVEVPDEIGE